MTKGLLHSERMREKSRGSEGGKAKSERQRVEGIIIISVGRYLVFGEEMKVERGGIEGKRQR